MRKLFFFLLISSLVVSCTSNQPAEETTEPKNEQEMSLEELAKRHVEADLAIPATEKYSLKIHKEKLNSDDQEDAIITVNRLAYAYDEAEHSNKSAKYAELGFVGNYNFIFFYDGALKKITPSIPIMSSALSELKINFVNLMSDNYKDFTLDYRLIDASYKDFISIVNHNPKIVFEWAEYENLGKNTAKANYFEIVEKQIGLPKEIHMYEGNLTNNKIGIDRTAPFEPLIEKGKVKKFTWFFEPTQGKYCTLDR